jgi:hypothetical protein
LTERQTAQRFVVDLGNDVVGHDAGEAASALVPTSRLSGCVASNVSPAPAIAPSKMREIFRMLAQSHSRFALRWYLTTVNLAGLWLLSCTAYQVRITLFRHCRSPRHFFHAVLGRSNFFNTSDNRDKCLALLWQISSRRSALQIHFTQCGHRCGSGRAISSEGRSRRDSWKWGQRCAPPQPD